MPVQDISDPRLQALFGANDPRDAGVKPTVRLPRKGLPPAIPAVVAAAFALILFAVLNARRTALIEPATRVRTAEPEAWAAPPPLFIPPAPAAVTTVIAPPMTPRVAPAPQLAPAPTLRTVPSPAVYAPIPQVAPAFTPPPPRASAGAPLVIDTTVAASDPAAEAPGPPASPNQQAGRLRASAFANRSTTVPQGYVIPAVLETGFDSTKAGFARAIVSRDVRGFDGKNILIPRGSRLIGEYRSDVAAGQKRAVVNWTRLIRPDGMTIAMDSPAVDTLGRGGITAHVNTHFFERLGGALLQSTFAIGSALVNRGARNPVVVVPAGAGATIASPAQPTDISPTLTVAPGKSISVFVAHDLDFSGAEAGR